MLFQELKERAAKLPTNERLELANAMLRSLSDLSQTDPSEPWQFLVERPHPWRRQLYIKGRKLRASTIWSDMIVNEMTPEEAAEDWDLPVAAIHEAVCYCKTHEALLNLEAEEERRRLNVRGSSIEPAPSN